jgi:hypothetical protein
VLKRLNYYRVLLLVFTTVFIQRISAQVIETETVTSIRGSYTMCNNKIYEGTEVDPSKFYATVKANQIIKLDSSNPNDVLFTIVKERVYCTGDTTQKNLLFFIKGKEIFLRTKTGGFQSAGFFTKDSNGDYTLVSFLEPLEFFAFKMAEKAYGN